MSKQNHHKSAFGFDLDLNFNALEVFVQENG
jgi:hypothetical protein